MPPTSPRTPSDTKLLAAFLLFASGIGTLCYSAISTCEDSVLNERGRELREIAETRTAIVSFWLKERLSDVRVQAERRLLPSMLAPAPGRIDPHGKKEVLDQLSLRHAEMETLRSDAALPAALATRGSGGILEGIDYRCVPVLTAVGPVPGMTWQVFAKADRAEILVPVRHEALLFCVLSALLALVLGLALLACRQRSRIEQARADEALHESEQRYRFLFELSPDAVFVHRDGTILFANNAAAALFRAGSAQVLVGKAWREMAAAEEWPKVESHIASLRNGECAILPPAELRCIALDGKALQVEVAAARIVIDGAPAIMSVVRDISERRRAEALRLRECREQRDILMREVHHRIKNHLQGLIGLLRRQMSSYAELKPLLGESIAQINAIAIVHGLQGRDAGGRIHLCRLVTDIAGFLSGITGTAITLEEVPGQCFRTRICLPAKACRWAVRPEEAAPLALVLNELVTNALRHGDHAAAPVCTLQCDEAGARLSLRNRGRLPDTLNFAAGRGLGTGLVLVRNLLPSAGAVLELANREDGCVETTLRLTPPALTDPAPNQEDSRR